MLYCLNAWRDSITSGAIFTQKEIALHGHFIPKILIEVLGYTGFGKASEWNLQREQLNRQFYTLFDLTEEETALIEQEIQG